MTAIASNSYGSDFADHVLSFVLQGRKLVFPCDADGNVEMDRLTEVGRSEYLFARIMIRRERLPRATRYQSTRLA